MVGDWPERDVAGAKLVGMKTAFAKYGDVFNTKDSGADYDLNNISEIVLLNHSKFFRTYHLTNFFIKKIN